METEITDRIIREAEVRALTGLSRTQRWRLIRRGEFPVPIQLSANCIGHKLSAIQEWLKSRPQVAYAPEAQAGGNHAA